MSTLLFIEAYMQIYIKEIIAGIVLFWPIVALVFGSIFIVFFFIILFVAGTTVIISLLFYGTYAALRDSGALEIIVQLINRFSDSLTSKLHKNVSESFLLEGFHNIQSDAPRIYACSPHGLYGFSWYLHFCTNLTNWNRSLPKPKLAIHSAFFKIPLVRELMLSRNCIAATECDISAEIERGNSVAIVVGGIEELQQTMSGKINLILQKRGGYIRIAKKYNIDIQPAITLGENELFPFSDIWIWQQFQKFLYEWFHIAFPIPKWSSLKRWMSIINSSLEIPCKTTFLESIESANLSEELIKEKHINLIKAFAVYSKHHISIVS